MAGKVWLESIEHLLTPVLKDKQTESGWLKVMWAFAFKVQW